MGNAPKSWDEANGTAHITAMPTRQSGTRRFYHVYGRRSSDFAVLSRDFEIVGVAGGFDAEEQARKYIAFLKGRGFDQIGAEFRTSLPVTLGVLSREASDD
ncbi:hypothetical protein [Tabrizicola sp. M-4]|uniref:hypothetical protein n=1 Tax=Tabrizicola sp. M-4 TaxID=3055847 RepID=UPI003DA97F2E